MSWSAELYLQFDDEPAARAALGAFGVAWADLPRASDNWVVTAPIRAPWVREPTYDADGNDIDAGEREPGYWVMLILNDDWDAGPAVLDACGAWLRTPASPTARVA